MRWTTAATLLFVFYCVEVGVFLVIAPWSAVWDRTLISLPFPALHAVYLNPWFRGAASGFGIAHILWGAHDLERWLAQRQAAAESARQAGESG